jgi:hypothetical protein
MAKRAAKKWEANDRPALQKCYGCGEVGHIRPQCPKREAVGGLAEYDETYFGGLGEEIFDANAKPVDHEPFTGLVDTPAVAIEEAADRLPSLDDPNGLPGPSVEDIWTAPAVAYTLPNFTKDYFGNCQFAGGATEFSYSTAPDSHVDQGRITENDSIRDAVIRKMLDNVYGADYFIDNPDDDAKLARRIATMDRSIERDQHRSNRGLGYAEAEIDWSSSGRSTQDLLASH